MKNERCQLNDHSWYCIQVEGKAGEIIKKTPIPKPQAEQILVSPDLEEQLCPGGRIACFKCSTPLVEGNTPNSLPNFSDLKSRLIDG